MSVPFCYFCEKCKFPNAYECISVFYLCICSLETSHPLYEEILKYRCVRCFCMEQKRNYRVWHHHNMLWRHQARTFSSWNLFCFFAQAILHIIIFWPLTDYSIICSSEWCAVPSWFALNWSTPTWTNRKHSTSV